MDLSNQQETTNMCNETKTGAELKQWRERLGLSEEWGASVLRDVTTPFLGPSATTEGALARLRACEGPPHMYTPESAERFHTAYIAALTAEEAKLQPVEPVCPEGVSVWANGSMRAEGAVSWAFLRVEADGAISWPPLDPGDGPRPTASPALLEYAAALSRYRVALHAAGDRQRKLDAVRAAEEAHDAAHKVAEDAHTRYRELEAAVGRSFAALNAARREAGL